MQGYMHARTSYTAQESIKKFWRFAVRCLYQDLHARERMLHFRADRREGILANICCLSPARMPLAGLMTLAGLHAMRTIENQSSRQLCKFCLQGSLHASCAALESCLNSFCFVSRSLEHGKHPLRLLLSCWRFAIFELKGSGRFFCCLEAANLSPDSLQVSLQELTASEQRCVVVAGFHKSLRRTQLNTHAPLYRSEVVCSLLLEGGQPLRRRF